jgi:putative DNA primase/helicase
VECPTLRPDGTVLSQPGYDAATHLFYYHPASALPEPHIPTHPTQDQARAAATFLCDELLGDFPFCDTAADRANMLACLLTPVVRPAINGCVPLCLLDKPSPGSGATLLSDVVATIATGEYAVKVAAPTREEEWQKTLFSLLRDGSPVIVLDNLEMTLASSALSLVLTTPWWGARLLGEMSTLTLPVRATWIATANNIALKGDIARRSYRVRIDAQDERPWMRENFKHPELLTWVRENRVLLLNSLLTIARAWFAGGKPSVKTPKIGGFEPWTRTIGGMLAYTGVEGFLGNLESLYDMIDEDAQQWAAFFAAWYEHLGEQFVKTAELSQSIEEFPTLREAKPDAVKFNPEKKDESNKSLGEGLRKKAFRVYGGLRLERDDTNKKAKVKSWRVRRIGGSK